MCVRACVLCVPLPFLVYLVMGQCIHSSEGSILFAPMVEWDDSTVVGISQRSPVSGERVVKRVQGGCVSEGQGTHVLLSHALVIMHIFCQRMACIHKHVVMHTTQRPQTSPVVGTVCSTSCTLGMKQVTHIPRHTINSASTPFVD